MKRGEKLDDIRRKLIEGTIQVIAGEGLDGASTKQIGTATATNEAYIYRCFQSKEDMFAKTFAALDNELVEKAMRHVTLMYMQEIEYEERCRSYFLAVWRFLLGNRAKCLTYIQYYYSPYFIKYSLAEHKKRFLPLVQAFSNAFKEDADVWMILNHILNAMFDFAVKVHNGQLPESEDYAERIFRVIYCSVEQYFKKVA